MPAALAWLGLVSFHTKYNINPTIGTTNPIIPHKNGGVVLTLLC